MTIAALLHASPLDHVHAEPLAVALVIATMILAAVAWRRAKR